MNEALDNLKTDFTFYRWGVLALLIAFGAGGAVVLLTQDFYSRAQGADTAAQKQLSDARRDLAAAEDDQQNMAAYAQEYAALLSRDIVGRERPLLDWYDGLKALRRENIVLGFKYNIGPEQPYKPPVAVDSGNFALNMSSMTLSFDLLHEGQLANFFDALRSNINGFYMLGGCTVSRVSVNEAGSPSGFAPSLRAECQGEWLTLRNRNAP